MGWERDITQITGVFRDQTWRARESWSKWTLYLNMYISIFGWWFGSLFIFPYIGNNHPSWLIFFRGVETTNQQSVMNGNAMELWMEDFELQLITDSGSGETLRDEDFLSSGWNGVFQSKPHQIPAFLVGIPSGEPTWLWKITMFNWWIHSNMAIFIAI